MNIGILECTWAKSRMQKIRHTSQGNMKTEGKYATW